MWFVPGKSEWALLFIVVGLVAVGTWEGCKYAATSIREHVRVEWKGGAE